MPSWGNGVQYQLVTANCQPVGLYQSQLVYNTVDASTGLYNAYCGSNPLPGARSPATHRGASSLVGSLCLVETATGTLSSEEPGKGIDNDINLVDLASGSVTRLTSSPGDWLGPWPHRPGTIWATLHPSGARLCWSQYVSAGDTLGYWAVHVADIVGGALANERAFSQGNAFYETYGWLQDGRLLFASDAGVGAPSPAWMGHWFASQIWAMPDQAGAAPSRLSPADVNYYCEFAFQAPDGDTLIYGSCRESVKGGLDYWRLSLSDLAAAPVRVTNFNAAAYANVGGLVFDPDNPKLIHAGVSPSLSAPPDYYQITLP